LKFLYCCDLHYSRAAPEGRTDDYAERLRGKMNMVNTTAMRYNVDAIVIGGDLFDRKGDVTMRELADVAAKLREWGEHCPILSVWGNHDAAGPDGVLHRPYGVLKEAGLIHDVDHETEPLGVEVGGVIFTGCGHRADYECPESYVPNIKSGKPVVILTHGMLLLKSRRVPFEHTKLDSVVGQTARVVLCAHVHDRQGLVQHGGCLYVSPGGLSRVSRPEEARDVSVAIVTVDDSSATAEMVELDLVPGGFKPDDSRESFSAVDAREAADALTLDGGRGLIGDVEEAVKSAAAKLKHGPEVVSEAMSHVRAASGD
jgi:DNA repair exonuclease SbcCD nuclease subunit